MTDLCAIAGAIRDTPHTVREIASLTGYTESAVSTALIWMQGHPREWTLTACPGAEAVRWLSSVRAHHEQEAKK